MRKPSLEQHKRSEERFHKLGAVSFWPGDFLRIRFFVTFGDSYPCWERITILLRSSKLALPYIWRLIHLILFTCPSTLPLLQGNLIPFSTTFISMDKPYANDFRPDNFRFAFLTKSGSNKFISTTGNTRLYWIWARCDKVLKTSLVPFAYFIMKI